MTRAYNFQLDTSQVEVLDYTRNYYLTRLFNSLSLLFPKGELHFINSIRHYEDKLDDELLQEAKIFYKEEGVHSREHRKLNKLLKDVGYDTDALEKAAERKLKLLGNRPEANLMITVSLEIFTAYGAELLQAIDRLIFMDNEACNMWRWHAFEEAGHGHRSIAHKVLTKINPNYSKVKLAFIFILSMILLIVQTMENWNHLSEF